MQTQMEQLSQIQANINKTHSKVLRHFINMEFVRAIRHPKFQRASHKDSVSNSLKSLQGPLNMLPFGQTLKSKPKTAVRKLQQEMKRIDKARDKRAKQADKEDAKQAKAKATATLLPKESRGPTARSYKESRTKGVHEDGPFDNYYKFKVVPNDKTLACKWVQHENQTKSPINQPFNTGIPTGERNNLLVVDLDVKDDGVTEFQKYLDHHGNINTLIIETPSKGQHYYFNFSHASPEIKTIIDTYLKTASKYRNKGIDIRANGGYIVAPPIGRAHV